MTKITGRHFAGYYLGLMFFSASTMAFSPAPENDKNYSPPTWTSNSSVNHDASDAIEHKDFRLLGFAGRGNNIPGIDPDQQQSYREKCGVRYFKNFGDIIREKEQLEQMKKARQYATEYNKIIIIRCTLTD